MALNNIEIGEWGIRKFKNQVQGELGNGLGESYNFVKAIHVVRG